jgi:hypothetical protein
VTAACCANAECGSDGYPATCDYACALAFVPFTVSHSMEFHILAHLVPFNSVSALQGRASVNVKKPLAKQS